MILMQLHNLIKMSANSKNKTETYNGIYDENMLERSLIYNNVNCLSLTLWLMHLPHMHSVVSSVIKP